MTLATDLHEFQAQFRRKVSNGIKTVMGQVTQDLATSGIVNQALKVGDSIPNFMLSDALGKTVHIKNILAQGPVVISFY